MQSFWGLFTKPFLGPKFPTMMCGSVLHNNMEHSLTKKHIEDTLFFPPASVPGFVIQEMLY